MLVDQQPFTRRTSYGPSSPVVGTRGARRRQQIVDAALQCFTERGFHATGVEDIATLANTSRATLYQYFESKEAIFIELMDEAGAALMRVTRRLGPLGPTAQGFDNLHWWLGEWAWVFDRYSAMFVEWANVNSPKAPLRPKLVQFIENHTRRFHTTLTNAGFDGDPDVASVLVLALLNRYNYIRHVYKPGLTDAQMLESLTIALQLFLFPGTPSAVLEAGPQSAERPARPAAATAAPTHAIGPLATLPDPDEIVVVSPFEGLSAQAARTVRQLLDAAGTVFANGGYDAANVDQIVTEANLARGTFYRYFHDKLELIIALANEAAAEMSGPFRELGEIAQRDDPAALRQWLHGFLALHDRYAGVLRVWTEGSPVDPRVLAPCRDTVIGLGAALRNLFGNHQTYGLSRRAAGVMVAALLEHFPNEGKGTTIDPTPDQIVETQAMFIERVLLRR